MKSLCFGGAEAGFKGQALQLGNIPDDKKTTLFLFHLAVKISIKIKSVNVPCSPRHHDYIALETTLLYKVMLQCSQFFNSADIYIDRFKTILLRGFSALRVKKQLR